LWVYGLITLVVALWDSGLGSRWSGGSRNDPAVGKIEVVVADARGSGGVSASV
jgi:hypothetical protein